MKLLAFVFGSALALSLVACGGGNSGSTAPIQREGTVSSRSAPFQKYSGKGAAQLRIAEFGVEASDEDRAKAQVTLEAYLQAASEGDWAGACGAVSEVLDAQIAEIAADARQTPEPGCGEILRALAGVSSGQRGLSLTAPGGISSLRIKEGPGGGFALFRGSDGRDYWMAVKREAGGWKVLSAVPQRFGQ